MFHHSGIVLSLQRDETSISRYLAQKSPGVHRRASKLNSELLADMILCPYWAWSASPPRPDSGHKSPARPASCSHSHRFACDPMPLFPPEVKSFRFFYDCLAFILSTIYGSSIIRALWLACGWELAPKFEVSMRTLKSKLKIISLEVDSACDAQTIQKEEQSHRRFVI